MSTANRKKEEERAVPESSLKRQGSMSSCSEQVGLSETRAGVEQIDVLIRSHRVGQVPPCHINRSCADRVRLPCTDAHEKAGFRACKWSSVCRNFCCKW
jgi:hypothetical protein